MRWRGVPQNKSHPFICANYIFMSWSDSFPLFDDCYIDRFHQEASLEERAMIEGYFAIHDTFNLGQSEKILSTSLGLHPAIGCGTDIGSSRPEEMADFSIEVEDFATKAVRLKSEFPELTVRVYLARDLHDFIPRLVESGCEVFLMEADSTNTTAVSLWRLLAFEQAGAEVTISAGEVEDRVEADIRRTNDLTKAGLGFWRIPFVLPETANGDVHYRPISGHQYGGVGGLDIASLLSAFTWHCMKQSFPALTELPGCGAGRLPWADWSSRYFSEWFLAAVIYPRVVESGVLTFLASATYSPFLVLDIEYATWANPNAQLIVTPNAHCCVTAETPDVDHPSSVGLASV